MKCAPAPVTMTQRAASSRPNSAAARASSRAISGPMAFIASGWFRTMRATAPSRSRISFRVIRRLTSGLTNCLGMARSRAASRRRCKKAVEVLVSAPEKRCVHHQPAEIVAHIQLLGESEAAVHLDRLVRNMARGIADIRLDAADYTRTLDGRPRQRSLGRKRQRSD